MHAHQVWLARRQGLSVFGDFAPFQIWPNFHGVKKQSQLEKFMQVEIDVKCINTNFSGCGLSGFGVMAPFSLPSKRPKFPFVPWTIQSMGVKKQNQLKKFIQVEVGINCMQTNFGGPGLFGFGVMAPFQFWPNFPFRPQTIVHGGQKNGIGSKY